MSDNIDLDQYKLLDKIGESEFGETFRIKEISKGEIYVSKIIKIEVREDQIQLIGQKVNSIKVLNHASLHQIKGFSGTNFDKSSFPTVISAYSPNGSLRGIINDTHKKWDITRKMINIYGIASCLKFLHSNDILHLDLKPENVLLDEFLFPRVTDFILSELTVLKSSEKRSNFVYLSPEILRNESPSKSSDVYSFAIVSYEILTGVRPFNNLSFNEFIEKVAVQNERPELTEEIPVFLKELIRKCWNSNPEERPNFDEIVNELKNSVSSEKLDVNELQNYIDYIESNENDFEEFINQKGRKTEITKVTIKQENSFFSFKTIKNFFGSFFKSSEKDETPKSENKEDNEKEGGFFKWSKSTVMKEQFEIESQGCQLRGFIIRPKKSGKYPVAIVSHGFGSCTRETKKYGQIFVEEGYVAVLFDFCMSGSGRSSGSSLGMSVLTEKTDLINVIDYVKGLDYIDVNKITLVGCSQGGFVSALAAVDKEEEIEKLIMYYPALCIPDDARRGQMINAKFDPNNIPDQFRALFVKLSSKYATDVINMDPFNEICSFKKPVLIVHGVKDRLVDIKYSRRARDCYSNCELVEVNGDHGFLFSGFSEGKRATIQFLNQFK